MTASSRLQFGYNPPTGDRLLEPVNPRTYTKDLQGVLDVATQSCSSLWISDHHMTGDRFRLECWSVLMWVAARYPGPMLGTCVMANSYRHPPLLAKMAASLQYLSSGRFIFGYGAGWTEEEYLAYGYEFPSARVRIAQLDDGVRAIKALWTESPATYTGPYYEVKDAYCEPRPDPLPPLMLAGDGERYMLKVVAEHADWWLSYSRRPEVQQRKLNVLAEHCKSFGRDPSTIKKAAPVTLFLDRDRAAARNRAGSRLEGETPAFAGDASEFRDYLAELQALGFDLVQLSFANFPETHDLKLFADEVVPHFT
ncbi:MAG TPA: LLM class flavin-dependent oxidoreductase [Chloroflexota bacterium]|nr:LLM class flavin-dependent oxidoreductase [Chloroflexota bacterium]